MIEKAGEDCVDAVMEIVRDVIAEMKAAGNTQWDESYPDRARFLRDIRDGALFAARRGEQVLGFVVADHAEPPGYRGLTWSDGDALIMHRLAIASTARKAGVASRLEQFVCDLARRDQASLIKVDTYSTNNTMQAFLTAKGYRKVGEMEFRGKPLPFFCYEKRL